MNNIKLLDCTLRDGAYINNSEFGYETIKGIISKLTQANIDIIEVGWLKEIEYKTNSTYYSSPSDIEQFIPNNQNNLIYTAMVDYGRYNLENLPEHTNKTINAIRLVFPIEKHTEAIKYSKIIKDKGYKLFLQAANTQSYSDKELMLLSKEVNEIKPDSISIVDTFGVMYKDDLKRIFNILNNNLDTTIKIGFHSHNNLQLSFALSIEFIQLAKVTKREIVIDSSLCGMGRGAGNICTELISNYINQKIENKYDLDKIMDTIDVYMKSIINNYTWGYSVPLCIAGQLGSHVNNIAYLQNIHKTNYKDIKGTLELIPRSNRKFYDYDKLEEAYIKYMSKNKGNDITYNELKLQLKNKNILLIAPGASIIKNTSLIIDYINKTNPVVIGINSFFNQFNYDFLFFSNPVRYSYILEQNKILQEDKISMIVTSNIDCHNQKKYIVDYNELVKTGWKYFDNSTIIMLRLLAKININNVFIAGFDGYSQDNSYVDFIFQSGLSGNNISELNSDIESMIKDFLNNNQNFKINYITPSLYQK